MQLKNVFNSSKIVSCFFHFTEAIWRKASIIDLRNKEIIKDAKF